MDDTNNQIKLKQYHFRCIRLTGEYIGGITAGFGLGIMAFELALKHEFISPDSTLIRLLFSCALTAIGASIARRAQNRTYDNNQNCSSQKVIS